MKSTNKAMKKLDAIDAAVLINAIPISRNDQKLSGAMTAAVIMLKVAYSRAVDEFDQIMVDVLKKLKEERFKDFDKMHEEIQKMNDISSRKAKHENWTTDAQDATAERPAMPSDEELAEMERIKATVPDYEAMTKELNQVYSEARNSELGKEIACPGRFTKDQFAELCGFLNGQDPISVFPPFSPEVKFPVPDFLTQLALNVVEQ